MNKLYSTKALIIKAIYSACVPLLIQTVSFWDADNSLYVYFAAMLILGLMYSIPFVLSVFNRKSFTERASYYIIRDGVCVVAPFTLSTVISDAMISTFVTSGSEANGVISFISLFLFFALALIFWIIYSIINKRSNRS